MLALLAALAAPQDSLQQDERLEPTVVNAEHQRISLAPLYCYGNTPPPLSLSLSRPPQITVV